MCLKVRTRPKYLRQDNVCGGVLVRPSHVRDAVAVLDCVCFGVCTIEQFQRLSRPHCLRTCCRSSACPSHPRSSPGKRRASNRFALQVLHRQ